LAIVVDSISFQLPITQLPISLNNSQATTKSGLRDVQVFVSTPNSLSDFSLCDTSLFHRLRRHVASGQCDFHLIDLDSVCAACGQGRTVSGKRAFSLSIFGMGFWEAENKSISQQLLENLLEFVLKELACFFKLLVHFFLLESKSIYKYRI
jgi:hypothetical protein